MPNIQLNGESFALRDTEESALADWLRAHDGGDLAAQLVPAPTVPHNLAAALAAVQAEIPEVIKTEEAKVKSDKGDYKYSYADLSAVTRAILPTLGRVGLSWVTLPTVQDGKFMLVYRLMHASGDFIEGSYPLPAGLSPQQTGSAITYARRYCLCSVTGVAPSDDDDAAEAQAAYRRGESGAAEAPAKTGMSQFERDAGLAFLARPSADRRSTTPTATLHAALRQALDFMRCLDEHQAWDAMVGETTWGAALAARVIDEIEHADTQTDVNTLWTMLKSANYNPAIEGKNMTSRIKERAAAIVARNAAVLDGLAERVATEPSIAELEGPVTAAITKAYTDFHITEAETQELTRILHDRVIKLGRSSSAYDEDGHKPTSPELRNEAPTDDGDDPWAGK